MLAGIASYVSERSGCELSKPQEGRLRAAVRERQGTRSDEEYLRFLRSPAGAVQLVELMSAIAVHKTELFRDEVQLEAVSRQLLPVLLGRQRTVRVWSAGCATGEEVATLLVLLREAGAAPDSTVLGTDISESALQRASELSFEADALRHVPERLRDTYFRADGARFALHSELKAQASFAHHNLMDFPYRSPRFGLSFDLIFCRNVLIYFTPTASEKVLDGFAHALAPGGALVLSSAEPALRPRPLLKATSFEHGFFYFRRHEEPRPSPPVTAELAVAPVPRTAEMPPFQPEAEARKLFELVLEWAAAGAPDAQTEEGLRKALHLAPDLAAGRYMLGLLLEQRSQRAEAAREYARALATLKANTAVATAFFLNPERLTKACELGLVRLGLTG